MTVSESGMGLTTTEMQRASIYFEADWGFMDETTSGPKNVWWILKDKEYPE